MGIQSSYQSQWPFQVAPALAENASGVSPKPLQTGALSPSDVFSKASSETVPKGSPFANMSWQDLRLAGEALYRMNRFTEAIMAFTALLQGNNQDYDAYNKRGLCKSACKDYPGALADYTQALAVNPKFYKALVNRGNLKSHLSDYMGALSDYGQAIRLAPFNTIAYANRGELLDALNRRDLAVQDKAKEIEMQKLRAPKPTGMSNFPRIALVLGNADYDGEQNDLFRRPIRKYGGPIIDVAKMTSALELEGFQVMGGSRDRDGDCKWDGLNLSGPQMQAKVKEFVRAIEKNPNAIAFVYYSGHGGAINNNTYLIPTDFTGSTGLDFQGSAVSMDSLMQALQDSKSRFNIVVVDACREELIQPAQSKGWEFESRPGLTKTWIEYACRPGDVSLQYGEGLYTKYLLNYFHRPDISLKELFMRASYDLERDPVAQEKGKHQHPRSQTDLTYTEPFAEALSIGQPGRPAILPPPEKPPAAATATPEMTPAL